MLVRAPSSGVRKHIWIGLNRMLSGNGTLRQMPESIMPGCRQLAVTAVPSSRRASSRVNMMLAHFDT
uniref:Uncharacterized protein n=1 Tax=Anopheles dirus TaxID=7168 RepID=A0A182NWB8_9DIPT